MTPIPQRMSIGELSVPIVNTPSNAGNPHLAENTAIVKNRWRRGDDPIQMGISPNQGKTAGDL